MNLIKTEAQEAMTSLEISDLAEKRIVKYRETLVNREVIVHPQVEEVPKYL